MKEQDKDLNKLSDRYLKDLNTERPSMRFAQNIMDRIALETKSNPAYTYEPLIGKKGWTAIAIFAMAFFAILFSQGFSGFGVMENVNAEMANLQFKSFDVSVPFPNLFPGFLTGLGILTVMILIEIPLLKRLFDKYFIQ